MRFENLNAAENFIANDQNACVFDLVEASLFVSVYKTLDRIQSANDELKESNAAQSALDKLTEAHTHLQRIHATMNDLLDMLKMPDAAKAMLNTKDWPRTFVDSKGEE